MFLGQAEREKEICEFLEICETFLNLPNREYSLKNFDKDGYPECNHITVTNLQLADDHYL